MDYLPDLIGRKPFPSKERVIEQQDFAQCQAAKNVLSHLFKEMSSSTDHWRKNGLEVNRPETNKCFQRVVGELREKNWEVHVPKNIRSVSISLPSSRVSFGES